MVRISSYTREYESHPGKPLYKHINNVCARAISLDNTQATRWACLFHDVGKLNPNFALKLQGKNTKDLYTSHAYLSLYAFLNFCRQCPSFVKENLKSDEERYAAMITMMKHHGSIPNIGEVINSDEWDRLSNFLKSKPYLPAEELLALVNLCELEFDPYQKELSLDIVRRVFSLSNLSKKIDNVLDFYFCLRMTFSSLVCGDKGDAGSYDEQSKNLKGYEKKVHKFLAGFGNPTAPLNVVRTKVRNTVTENLNRLLDEHDDKRVFCLTSPTGSGKTATLLECSACIFKKREVEKIVYAIPFLSITEQVYDIIKNDVFEEKEGEKNPIVKRIDSKASTEEDEETVFKRIKRIVVKFFSGDKRLEDKHIQNLLNKEYLDNTVDYPIVVTTFVNLFETFTTASNKGLMRFSHLQKAVILVDEIQSLPPRLYTFFVALLDEYCRRYNSYAIISTATMPNLSIPVGCNAKDLFKNYQEPQEIGEKKYYYEKVFNRYKIKVLNNYFTHMAIALKIAKESMGCMAVFNTIKDSVEIYNIVKQLVDCPVYLLNSNFHAKDRRSTLEDCKKLLSENKKVFLISTQVIEAGVDIDFPVVYRDIAPLPNVIQTAGRCNREGKLDFGTVYVFRLVDCNMKLRSRLIYSEQDKFFLDFSINQFFNSGIPEYEEKDLLTVQEKYFKDIALNLKIGNWKFEKRDENLVDQIKKFLFNDIGKFRIIPESRYGAQEQFYIPENSEDDSFEKLQESMIEMALYEESYDPSDKDRLKKILGLKAKIRSLRKRMMDRVVQVNIPGSLDLKFYVEYEDMYMHLYKLRPCYYSREYGITLM